MDLKEARVQVALQHPAWSSEQIENGASAVLARLGVLEAEDELARVAQELAVQGNPWGRSQEDIREKAAWEQMIEAAEKAEDRKPKREKRPAGWTY